MNCEQAKERWHEYLESGSTDAALSEHLRSCASCRAYTDDMGQIVAELARLREETESVTDQPMVHEQDSVKVRTARGRRLLRGLSIAAAVGLVAGATLYVAFHGTNRSPKATPGTLVQNDRPNRENAKPDTIPTLYGLSLRGNSATRLLAVAVPTGEPTIQLYELFPVIAYTASPDRQE